MPQSPTKWQHPTKVMKQNFLKFNKRKALQARLVGTEICDTATLACNIEDDVHITKQKNPFIANKSPKRVKSFVVCSEKFPDQTFYHLLHSDFESNLSKEPFIFNNILEDNVLIKKHSLFESNLLPIDWTLKTKMRLLSNKPFCWSTKLKIGEEASGVTGFCRCLDSQDGNSLDISANAKFYQCCLYWQQPWLPWMSVFPRENYKDRKLNVKTNITMIPEIKQNLQKAWFAGLRSLFQLIRTKQCSYFYVCANQFTALFRAAGICGYSDIHVLVTPTSRGFREMLNQENIEFKMPLQKSSSSGHNSEHSTFCRDKTILSDEDGTNSTWLKSMGFDFEDIKQINYTQVKKSHKQESCIDESDESLVFIEGVEVHAFYNFLINCKSTIAANGPTEGVPPTLLSPVAFHGATLNSLNVKESNMNINGQNYNSIEFNGPILPTTLHHLFALSPPEQNITATFLSLPATSSFSKVKLYNKDKSNGELVFGRANLSDCGLHSKVLDRFCNYKPEIITNVECINYDYSRSIFTWP